MTDGGFPTIAFAGFARGRTLGGWRALCPFVSYGTSGGAPPVGQSSSLPGWSGRDIDVTYAAMSYACWSVSDPGLSKGMLCRMNDAARSTRAMEAAMLNDLGPQSAGAGPIPAPSLPWQ